MHEWKPFPQSHMRMKQFSSSSLKPFLVYTEIGFFSKKHFLKITNDQQQQIYILEEYNSAVFDNDWCSFNDSAPYLIFVGLETPTSSACSYLTLHVPGPPSYNDESWMWTAPTTWRANPINPSAGTGTARPKSNFSKEWLYIDPTSQTTIYNATQFAFIS